MGTSIVVDASVFDPVVFDPVVFNPLGVDAGVPLDLSVFAPDSKPYDPFAGVGVCAETLHATKPDLETLEKKLLSIQSMLIQSPIPLPEKEAEQQELFRQIRDIRAAPQRATATKFTTKYALEWVRKQGYTILAQERYDHRLNRTHDTAYGMDILATKGGKVFGFQAFTPGQEAAHLKKAWLDSARADGVELFFLIFTRGNKTPVIKPL